jgi:hypothetical protein
MIWGGGYKRFKERLGFLNITFSNIKHVFILYISSSFDALAWGAGTFVV